MNELILLTNGWILRFSLECDSGRALFFVFEASGQGEALDAKGAFLEAMGSIYCIIINKLFDHLRCIAPVSGNRT